MERVWERWLPFKRGKGVGRELEEEPAWGHHAFTHRYSVGMWGPFMGLKMEEAQPMQSIPVFQEGAPCLSLVEVLTLPPAVARRPVYIRNPLSACSLRSWVWTPDSASLSTPLGTRRPLHTTLRITLPRSFFHLCVHHPQRESHKLPSPAALLAHPPLTVLNAHTKIVECSSQLKSFKGHWDVVLARLLQRNCSSEVSDSTQSDSWWETGLCLYGSWETQNLKDGLQIWDPGNGVWWVQDEGYLLTLREVRFYSSKASKRLDEAFLPSKFKTQSLSA